MGARGPETLEPGRSRALSYALLPPWRVAVGRLPVLQKCEARKDVDGEAGPAGTPLYLSVLPELSGAAEHLLRRTMHAAVRPHPSGAGGPDLS